jgi:hypothetical protein
MSSTELDRNLGFYSPGRPQGSGSAASMRARTAMYLPGEMNEQLGIIAKRNRVSVSEIIRRMIAQGLASNDMTA